mmetsp:Transcript_19322/g.44307  ORF Transcript_19322/g.44307 Transcript_19322/m.44307 type:complete len:104 (+) Transcript_19322:716-1027(+)
MVQHLKSGAKKKGVVKTVRHNGDTGRDSFVSRVATSQTAASWMAFRAAHPGWECPSLSMQLMLQLLPRLTGPFNSMSLSLKQSCSSRASLVFSTMKFIKSTSL